MNMTDDECLLEEGIDGPTLDNTYSSCPYFGGGAVRHIEGIFQWDYAWDKEGNLIHM